MVEQQRNDLTPQIEAHKSKLLVLQEQIDAQKGILEEEKGKKAKADRAKIETASQRLSALAEQMDLLNTENSTLNRLAKRSPMGTGVMSEVNGLFNGQDDQIDQLLAEAATILEAIPGIKTAADAQRMVDTLSVLENPNPTEVMVVYLHAQLQDLTQQILELRQQMAGRAPATDTRVAADAGQVTTVVATEQTDRVVATETAVPAKKLTRREQDLLDHANDPDYESPYGTLDWGDIGRRFLERVKRFRPKTATLEEKQLKKARSVVKKALGRDFNAVIGILNNPEMPEDRDDRDDRRNNLYPLLGVLDQQGLIGLTDEVRQRITADYAGDVTKLLDQLSQKYDEDSSDPAMISLLTWVRKNIHQFHALVEVVPVAQPAELSLDQPATTTAPAADGGTSEAGGNPTVVTSPTDRVTGVTDVNRALTNLAGDAAPGPHQELTGDGRAAAPAAETTVKNETDAKKKLKGLYGRVRSRVPESADDATKLNAVTTRGSGQPALLGEAIRNFTAVLDGKEVKFDENSADMQTQMLLLIVLSEVKSAYDKLNPKPKTTMAELKALVSRIAS